MVLFVLSQTIIDDSPPKFHPDSMTTLNEIENAAQALDRKDQEELFLFLAKQLRTDGNMPEPRVFDSQQIES